MRLIDATDGGFDQFLDQKLIEAKAPNPSAPQNFLTPQTSRITGDQHSTMTQMEWDVMVETNKMRRLGFTCPDGDVIQKVPSSKDLVVDCRLWWASKQHSEDMALNRYYAHNTKSNGWTPFERSKATAFGVVSHAENIVGVPWDNEPTSARSAVESWLNSQLHCMAMGDPMHGLIGPALYECPDRSKCDMQWYWTELFAWTKDTVAPEFQWQVPDQGIDTSCYPEGVDLLEVSNSSFGTVPVFPPGIGAWRFQN